MLEGSDDYEAAALPLRGGSLVHRAAPDLLAACQAARSLLERLRPLQGTQGAEVLEMVSRAVAKAEGRRL